MLATMLMILATFGFHAAAPVPQQAPVQICATSAIDAGHLISTMYVCADQN